MGIYSEAWESVRHFQDMRTTYFNFFLIILGSAIAAYISLLQVSEKKLQWEVYSALGIAIWLVGILSLVRIERLTALITHELHTVRQIRAFFVENYPNLISAIHRTQASISDIGFDRSLWSRDRTIEPIACVILSCLGVIVATTIMPTLFWMKIVLSLLGIVCVLWNWTTEVGYQMEKHSECCVGTKEIMCPTCSKKTSHHLRSIYGWRRHLFGRTVTWVCNECGSKYKGKV